MFFLQGLVESAPEGTLLSGTLAAKKSLLYDRGSIRFTNITAVMATGGTKVCGFEGSANALISSSLPRHTMGLTPAGNLRS